jgi:hypothetical protein
VLDRAVYRKQQLFCDVDDIINYLRENHSRVDGKTTRRVYHQIQFEHADDTPFYKTMPGTRSVRQMYSPSEGLIRWRRMSCTCARCHNFDFCDKPFQETPVPLSSGKEPAENDTVLDIDDVSLDIGVGDFVAINWDDDWFPAEVEKLDGGELTVSCLHSAEGGSARPDRAFKWPTKKDVVTISLEYVIEKIPHPVPISRRHIGWKAPLPQNLDSMVL